MAASAIKAAAQTTTAPAGPSTSVAAKPAAPLAPLRGLTMQRVASGLREPVDIAAPLNDGLFFVVERIGVVRIVENGKVAKAPFANLRSIVKSSSIEQGLLGIAFHPKYPQDRRVFFYHSRKDNDNLLVSYTVAPDGRQIDPATRVELLRVDKEPTAVRHNAGALRFAPDGLLYVAVGDAARGAVNSQNPKTFPGKILRIDVDTTSPGLPYGIPTGNPFADGVNGAPEVFWYGLRNPWRFSIDAPTGLAYIGDVGQEAIEEVNVVPHLQPGVNFGWALVQGNKKYSKGTAATVLTPPVLEVRHKQDDGCSITGGEVYRGTAIPELVGHYFYADWCLSWIRSFRYDGTNVSDKKDWTSQLTTGMVSSFGHDFAGELVVLDYENGIVNRIVARR